ncbi:MAG TPA: NUDIX hydrolase [Candidatus Acidoferrales bacterium]|nr:NUDIX hydrolase [Candidatus Acidoferrales bacterium]
MADESTGSLIEGRFLRFATRPFALSDGRSVLLDWVGHPGASAVVAVGDEGQVCLLRQYRPVMGVWMWEIPAGKRDGDEAFETTARRELVEETGCSARRWDALGPIWPSPAFCDEVIHLFCARELIPGDPRPDADEHLEVHWRTPAELAAMIRAGEILDSKTLAALMRASVAGLIALPAP